MTCRKNVAEVQTAYSATKGAVRVSRGQR